MDEDELTEKYALLCDAIARIFFAEQYGIEPYSLDRYEPPIGHTSDEARKGATAVVAALGFLE